MVRIGRRDGVALVESNEMDLKITPDREVYVRHGKLVNDNWTKPTNYKSIGRKVDTDMSIEEKQLFLTKLRSKVLENRNIEDKEVKIDGRN